MKPSIISPYSKRADPVMMSLAVSSSSALVISAPGTIMAIGAHTANIGTCVSPAPWASGQRRDEGDDRNRTLDSVEHRRDHTDERANHGSDNDGPPGASEQDGQTAGQQSTTDDPLQTCVRAHQTTNLCHLRRDIRQGRHACLDMPHELARLGGLPKRQV
jgi:hypothetical protein